MSELEHEAMAEADDELDTNIEPGDGDGIDGDEEGDGEPTDEGEPVDAEADGGEDVEPAQPPRDDREVEKLRKKMDAEDERHARRITEILGEDAIHLVQCPMCMHFASGWFFPPNTFPLPEENVAAAKVLLGVPNMEAYKTHPGFKQCEECDGLGEVLTGSKRQGYQLSTCPGCAAKGWKGSVIAPQNGTPPDEDVPVMTGPTTFEADDAPEIQALRARGFLVVPPAKAVDA